MIDPDDLTDALAGACGADEPRSGVWPHPATASDRRLKAFRAREQAVFRR
jgi:hypothetical protein